MRKNSHKNYLSPSDFLEEVKNKKLLDNENEKVKKEILKLRKRIDFNDPNDTKTIGNNTYIVICLDGEEAGNHNLGILNLLDEFEQKKKVKINSFNFDQRYFDKHEMDRIKKEYPEIEEPSKMIFNGIWINHT